MSSEYDDLHFPPNLSPITHVNQIAVVARLLGLPQPPLETCRVLDIGCAEGWQLTAMASTLPGASFVGIDLSQTQIERARDLAAEFGAQNVEYRCVDLGTLETTTEQFDYVIAHGVFSWLPRDAQAGLLDLVRRSLAPTGVALVSFNTLPGWHMGQVVREMLRYHVGGRGTPLEQVRESRRFLELLVRARDADDPHAADLRQLTHDSNERAASYFFHEYLAPENHALWFHEFMAAAHAHGLAYLGDAHFGRMLLQQLPANVREAVEALDADRLGTEQYIDFLTHRKFRHTLLYREQESLGLGIGPDAMTPLRVATDSAPLPPDEPHGAEDGEAEEPAEKPSARFRAPNGTVFSVRSRLAEAAMHILIERQPLAMPFDDLLDAACERVPAAERGADRAADRATLAGDLILAFADWGVHLAMYVEPLAERVEELPRAFPLARAAAREGWKTIPNPRHMLCRLGPFLRRTLAHLDGETDAAALVATLAVEAKNGSLELPAEMGPATRDIDELRRRLTENLPRALEILRQNGMLLRA